MNLFKPKQLIEPTKEALEKSIRNNLLVCNILQFIFFGLLTIYTIYYMKTGKYEIPILIFACIIAIFISTYLIIYKIERARLEIWKAIHEE